MIFLAIWKKLKYPAGLFINIILAFSDIDSRNCNDINEDIFDNRTIIKRIKFLRQLRRTEKELVRLNYKEAIIKGFTLKGIQQYIASKRLFTNKSIDWKCPIFHMNTRNRTPSKYICFGLYFYFSNLSLSRVSEKLSSLVKRNYVSVRNDTQTQA